LFINLHEHGIVSVLLLDRIDLHYQIMDSYFIDSKSFVINNVHLKYFIVDLMIVVNAFLLVIDYHCWLTTLFKVENMH